ncbi:MAG: helix-turn-helix domain-containing protein [bacterium]
MKTLEWKIYNFIKDSSLQNKWVSQQDILDYLNININKRTIRRYISNIRSSDVIQKIIITDYKKGYKILSNEEQFKILEKRKIAILKMLKQNYKDVKRFNSNNQMRITFGEHERKFIESLLEVK